MTADLSDDDRGKALVTRNTRLGVVTDVRGDTVYLDLDGDVPDGLRDRLDLDPDDETTTVPSSPLDVTGNDEVVVRDDVWPR